MPANSPLRAWMPARAARCRSAAARMAEADGGPDEVAFCARHWGRRERRRGHGCPSTAKPRSGAARLPSLSTSPVWRASDVALGFRGHSRGHGWPRHGVSGPATDGTGRVPSGSEHEACKSTAARSALPWVDV